MSAPVQPQQPGQPGARVIPRGQGSPSPSTPETRPPTAPSTEGQQPAQPGASVQPPAAPQQPTREQQLIAAQEQVLREQAQELARLRQGQRAIESRVTAVESPAPSREELNQKFWRDPMLIVDTIKEELKRTVEPINQLLNGQRTESEYDKMKTRMRTEYGDMWPHIEGYVDSFVEQAAAAGNPVNEQLVGVAALAATGAYHRGLLGNGQPSGAAPAAPPAPPAPPPPVQGAQDMIPPHLRPSAPAAPTGQARTEPRRELTENEARLARERGMNKDQFLDWIEVPPDQVVNSKIGRAQA